MSESERREQIEAAFRRTLEDRVRALRERLTARWSEALDEAVDGLARPPELDPAWFEAPPGPGAIDDLLGRLHEALRGLAAAEDQVSILNALVTAVAGFSGRSALFVCRQERAVGWASCGYGTGDVRQVALPLDGDSPLARAARAGEPVQEEGSAGARAVWEALGVPGSERHLALPVAVKGRIAAVLFTDAGPSLDSGSWLPGAARILARFAEARLDAVAMRGRAGGRDAGVERRPSQAWERPAAAAAAVPRPALPGAHPARPGPARSTVADASDPHEEAKRFARLLVSEILLYNETQVQEGRKNRDLWQRLREDLERSQQMYRQRVPAAIAASTDYFRDEVVRTLAEGDAGLLGTV
jgi:hypothetical protein